MRAGFTRRLHPSSGFTLVEILVAASLLSLTLLLLNSAMFSVQASTQATSDTAEMLGEWRQVRSFVAAQLAGAQPLARRNGNNLEVFFQGDEQQVRFVGTLPAYRGEGGLHFIHIGVEAGRSPTLVLLDSPADPQANFLASDSQTQWRRHLLLNAPVAVRFQYYGDTGSGASWHSGWQGQRALPELIRIELSDGTIAWPPIVIALRVQDPAGQGHLVW